MESKYSKNYLLSLSLWSLIFLNFAQARCVRKISESTVSTPSSSSPPTQSTSPSSSPSAPKSTPSSSVRAPKPTPSSSSPSPRRSTSSTNPSLQDSTPSSSTPSTPRSPSGSSDPSLQMLTTKPFAPFPPKTQPPSAKQTQAQPMAQPTVMDSHDGEATTSSPPKTQPPQAEQTQAPPMAPPTLMDSPDGEAATSSSPKTQPPPAQQTQALPMAPPTVMDSPDGEATTSSPTSSTPSPGASGSKISSTIANNDALKKICQHTDHPSLCLESISPFYNGKTQVMEVLKMAINASYAQTELGMKLIDKEVSKPATSSELASAIEDCKEIFEDALENLQSANNAIGANDIGTIQTMISAALSDYVTCTDGLPGPNPLGIYADKLNNMASNCLAIAALHK